MDNSVCISKIRYSTKFEAVKVSKRMSQRAGNSFIYKCDDCKGFHLTSQPQDIHKRVQEIRRARRRK